MRENCLLEAVVSYHAFVFQKSMKAIIWLKLLVLSRTDLSVYHNNCHKNEVMEAVNCFATVVTHQGRTRSSCNIRKVNNVNIFCNLVVIL